MQASTFAFYFRISSYFFINCKLPIIAIFNINYNLLPLQILFLYWLQKSVRYRRLQFFKYVRNFALVTFEELNNLSNCASILWIFLLCFWLFFMNFIFQALCTEAVLIALRECFPHIYLSADKLQIDLARVKVTRRHFEDALRQIVPAARRGFN